VPRSVVGPTLNWKGISFVTLTVVYGRRRRRRMMMMMMRVVVVV